MLRKGKWECLYYHGEEPELYDLEADPEEMNNRSRHPECRSLLDEMLTEILADWDPEDLQADMDRTLERQALVNGAPGDIGVLQNEYWEGPLDYGWVDPT